MTMTTNALLPLIIDELAYAFKSAPEFSYPFKHWEVLNVLPEELTDQILAVRIPRTEGFSYDGTRASDSQVRPGGTPPRRMFIDKTTKEAYPFFQDLVDALLSQPVIDVVNNKFGLDTAGLYLRVEYINDFDGFFLDPHKDIVEKRFSMLLFLGEGPEHMGTDFYDADLKVVKTVSFKHNNAYVFLPGDDTWHGLEKKSIPDRRCSLLINYVTFKTDFPVPLR